MKCWMRWFMAMVFLTGLTATGVFGLTTLELSSQSSFQDVIFSSNKMQGQLGTSMASGDFNGDGIPDVAVGQPREANPRSTTEVGMVTLFLGNSSLKNLSGTVQVGKTSDGSENARLYATISGNYFGVRMAAGDINKDGRDDLLIAAQSPTSVNDSAVYVFLGRASISGDINMDTSADIILDRTNMYVSDMAVGDLNGDNIDDMVISDTSGNDINAKPFASGHLPKGGIYIVFGKSNWSGISSVNLETQADRTILRNSGNSLFQPTCVAVGDVNGDSKGDLVIGAPLEDNPTIGGDNDSGRVYVIFGGATFPTAADVEIDSEKDVVIYGAQQDDQIGGDWSVTEAYSDKSIAVGDVNGDGIGDIIIGAPLSMLGEVSSTGQGKAEIVFGSQTLPASIDLYDSYDVRLNLSSGTRRIGIKTGYTVAAKDLNGDGIQDILVSSPGAPAGLSGKNGWHHIIYGTTNLSRDYELDTDSNVLIIAPSSTDPYADGRMGTSVLVGDFTDSGSMDILLGAPKGTGIGTSTSAGWVLALWDLTGGLDYVIGCLKVLVGLPAGVVDKTGDGIVDLGDAIFALREAAQIP